MPSFAARLDLAITGFARAYPGPGGACAVIRNGEILIRHAWGFANAEQRIPFRPQTLFRLCSITKQFTCAAVLDACPDPAALDRPVAARLPKLTQRSPTALQLSHNQSGLRDYWAIAMLHGAAAESTFGDAEAARVIAGTRTLHFEPGTRYAYANQNFRILSDALQDHTGTSFAAILRRLFDRCGMDTAFLAADTTAMPDGTTGYEGNAETGFRPAVNRILWTGDAGIGASLDDLIAWERHIDATRHDTASLYSRLSAPVHFADGAPAAYGFGLGRRPALGRQATGHGGALRGWRSNRIHLPNERLSAIVMFNHLSDAQEAASDLLRAVLDEPRMAHGESSAPDWLGAYADPDTGLAARIEAASGNRIRLRYGHNPELLEVRADGSAASDAVTLAQVANGIRMDRTAENSSTILHKPVAHHGPGPEGRYRCEELESELTIQDAGGVLYGAFAGFLGCGRMEALLELAPGIWALPCPRALDHTPPGDWTLRAHGQDLEVGCWLARHLTYKRDMNL